MQLDVSIDDVAWDNTEAVTLEVAARGEKPSRTVAVPVAKRRAVRTAQRSPSGGVYLGFEVRWHIPARVLPPEVAPAPADVIVDGGGTRWTVLTRDLNRLGQTHALGCVDLVLAHNLRDTVVIERASLGAPESGVPTKTFDQVLATCQARVQEISRQTIEERGARYTRPRYDVIVDRQLRGLDTAEDRVRWSDREGVVRHLDIVGYRSPERIDELPVLECQLR